MKRLLEQVTEVTNQRRNGYGKPLINFVRIALLWSTYQGRYISPVDVSHMLSLLKYAREMNSHNDDNLLDIMGYVDCWDSMNRQMKELGYSQGCETFRAWNVGKLYQLYGELLQLDGSEEDTQPYIIADEITFSDAVIWETYTERNF